MGMGKGAGNLNTELLLEHLNLYYGKQYKIDPLLEVIDKVINQLHTEFYWGYSPEYYLSSVNHCTPSYASHFYNKHMLPINQVSELLGMIAEDKKISFDKVYAEELYRHYNESKIVDDSDVVKEFQLIFKNKKVLLVAPGKSIGQNKDKIDLIINEEDTISMGLNLTAGFNVRYVLATRKDAYDKAASSNQTVLTMSSVSKSVKENVRVLNYKNWIEVDEKTRDSSLVVALNFLYACGVKEIVLAGFDGFSTNINENYFDPEMRRPVTAKEAIQRNDYYKKFISAMKGKGINITFATRSKYE